ncbi:MAG TPA: hypothetical protein VGP26_07730 [Actinophytocola sp.]|jgi:hypothetical protein|nr:hypothetical protein [Actinophytocola sp.]
MTGQDGGFRAAVARFRADVEAALTRARRAATDAKEQSAEFRRGSEDIARQARNGRLRAVRRGQATSPEAHDEAVKFRNANDLTVEELPDADAVTTPPDRPAERPKREEEDFSQHTVLYDIDAKDDPAPPGARPVDQTSDESTRPGIDSPTAPRPRPADDNDDFSQQRILFDATVESYRPEPLPDSVFKPSDEKNPS